MRIAIDHITRYRFARPAWHGVQRLRLTPLASSLQRIADWTVEAEGATIEAAYEDHHGNACTLISFGPGAAEIVVRSAGTVETSDTSGVLGPHSGCMPLSAYQQQTTLTRPGPRIAPLVAQFADVPLSPLSRLHDLSAAIRGVVAYEVGRTDAETTAESAFAAGHGVCQDHAHIFIGVARALGLPARYVSGYLWMADRTEQQAGHAWAEAHIPDLGWVGFDISNTVSPDAHYVRLAVGIDYRDAAPITGVTQGGEGGTPDVRLIVEQ